MRTIRGFEVDGHVENQVNSDDGHQIYYGKARDRQAEATFLGRLKYVEYQGYSTRIEARPTTYLYGGFQNSRYFGIG